MLHKGQSLTIERPQRTLGTVIGAIPALIAFSLALALVVAVRDWLISFPLFLAYLGAIFLFAIALLFAFWAYACASLQYVIDSAGLTIRWGPIRHVLPLGHIRNLMPGRGEQRPQVRGLTWWGHQVGRGHVEGLGEVLFYSTHRVPEDVVYVRTPTATYGLSPQDPMRFTMAMKRLQKAQANRQGQRDKEALERHLLAAHPIWTDRAAQTLALVAVVLNAALFGFLFAVYPDLSNQITISFPPIGDITTLDSKQELLKIPGTALALLAVNLIAALGFQWRERAAAYLILSGCIFLQVLFWIGLAIALANA